MNKIKVLQLGNCGELYGAERWILALIKHLDATKIESWVATVRDEVSLKAPLCLEAEKLGFPTKIFECNGRYDFSSVSRLRKFILENDIDIIHTHHYKTDLIGLLATKGTKCKIVSTPHGWSTHKDFKLWCYEILARCIFPLFDAVVPLSEDIYRPLHNIPVLKNKLHLIKNGVDISEIDDVTTINPEIQKWKDRNTFLIGCIGRLIPSKGLDILLEAAAQLTSLDWRLIFIGEGLQRNELEQIAKQLKISDRVDFLGVRTDRLSFLKGFDVFALPSKSEGIPRCLMEALAAQIPVVASDIPGCRDLITTNQTGLLFPPNRPDELAKQITKLAWDQELQKRLKQNGRQLIIEKFSATRMTEKYGELFFNLFSTQKKS